MIWRDFVLRPIAAVGIILCSVWMVIADTRLERGWFLLGAAGWAIVLRQGYYWGPSTRAWKTREQKT